MDDNTLMNMVEIGEHIHIGRHGLRSWLSNNNHNIRHYIKKIGPTYFMTRKDLISWVDTEFWLVKRDEQEN